MRLRESIVSVADTSQQVNETSESQASAIQETSSALASMTDSIGHISQIASERKETVNLHMADISRKIEDQEKGSVSVLGVIENAMNRLNQVLIESRRVKEIGEVNKGNLQMIGSRLEESD